MDFIKTLKAPIFHGYFHQDPFTLFIFTKFSWCGDDYCIAEALCFGPRLAQNAWKLSLMVESNSLQCDNSWY